MYLEIKKDQVWKIPDIFLNITLKLKKLQNPKFLTYQLRVGIVEELTKTYEIRNKTNAIVKPRLIPTSFVILSLLFILSLIVISFPRITNKNGMITKVFERIGLTIVRSDINGINIRKIMKSKAII